MSGHIALKLLEYKSQFIKYLVLFCPAIYSKDAYAVDFGPEFSEIIRSKNSWQNTDVLRFLKIYKGGLQIFYGEADNIVPKDVVELIYNGAKTTKAKELNLVADCGHKFLDYMNSESNRNEIINKIKIFVNNE